LREKSKRWICIQEINILKPPSYMTKIKFFAYLINDLHGVKELAEKLAISPAQ